MLRFFAGIVLVQAASVALVLLTAGEAHDWNAWLPIAVALGTIALVAAFWFTTVATSLRRDELNRLRADFAREREDLRVKAEREKTRMLRKNQKSLASETRRAETRANRKVALAVAAASALGVLMVFTSSIALGLGLLTGAGGALGGYLAGRRWPTRGGEIIASSPRRRWLRGPSSPLSKD